MPFTFTYHPEENQIRTVAEGEVTVPEILDYLNTVLANDRIRAGFIEVVDLSAVTEFSMRYSQAEVFAPLYDRYIAKGARGCIMYAPTDLAFGMFRMILTAIELNSNEESSRFIIVRTEEARDRAIGETAE